MCLHVCFLALGGKDESKYTGDVEYTPVTEKTYWKIRLGTSGISGLSFTSTIS
jgi:hypothetical protein